MTALTDELFATAANLFKDGKSAGEIAERFGPPFTASMVYGALYRAGYRRGVAPETGGSRPTRKTRVRATEEQRQAARARSLASLALIRERQGGWPTMRGSDEARDARFVRMVIAEAMRLGLCRAERMAAE